MAYKKDKEFSPLENNGSDLSNSEYVEGSKKIFPDSLQSNPSPLEEIGQDFYTVHRNQVEKIMDTFLQILPSNYVAKVRGPFYSLQFQSAAEELARIQIMAQETLSDTDYDFTRTEFLYQILGYLVNPDYLNRDFRFDTDLEWRSFLKRMVILLLNGSRKSTIQQGIYLLTEGDLTIIEKSEEIKRVKNTAYTLADQFEFEVSLSVINNTSSNQNHSHRISIDKNGNGKTVEIIGDHSAHTHEVHKFEVLPAEDGGHTHTLVSQFSESIKYLFDNLPLVLDILKPAHTIYQFRHLFREVFSNLFTDTFNLDLNLSHYDDLRKFCEGAKNISGSGDTLSDRSLFTDPTKNFRNVSEGATLTIENGTNSNKYRVKEVLCLPIGKEDTPRSYTTSNGLSGTLIVLSSDTIEDVNQDFSSCEEGTTITILDGSNKGTYRMEFLLGSNGGILGSNLVGSSTKVRLGYSTVRLTQRMKSTATNQNYHIEIDRLGVRKPIYRQSEDKSSLFYL